MKKLTITTKAAALIDAALHPAPLKKMRYDGGKYKTDRSLVGRELETGDQTFAVWPEKRADSSGPYQALYCLTAA